MKSISGGGFPLGKRGTLHEEPGLQRYKEPCMKRFLLFLFSFIISFGIASEAYCSSPPIIAFVEKGDVQGIKTLLAAGANINAVQ